MNRSILSLIGLVSLSLASVACSGAASDALSANSAADTTEGTATSATEAHVFRATDANDVTVVNQETTTCADGTRAASCTVSSIDFSALGLTADATNSLQASFVKGTALAKGKLVQVSHAIGGGSHAIELLPTLVVTQAWIADGDVAVGSFGQFEVVTKNAANCGAINADGNTESCEQYSLSMLNKSDTGSVAAVDFTASSAKAEAINNAESLLANGLVAFGYQQGVARGPMTFEVTSFFLPVTK